VNVLVVIESQAGSKRTIQMRANGPITIGRDQECGLRIKSDLISRRHAVVEFSGTAMRVEDRSTNGTLAGDQLLRKTSAWVPFGTPIVIGDHTLYFQSAGPPRSDLAEGTTREPPVAAHGSAPAHPHAQAHAQAHAPMPSHGHAAPPPGVQLPPGTMPLGGHVSMDARLPPPPVAPGGPAPYRVPEVAAPGPSPAPYRAPAAEQPAQPVAKRGRRPGDADNELRREISRRSGASSI
jgi:pilus assembly protein CpaF